MRAIFLFIALPFVSSHASAQQGQLDIVGVHPAGVGSVKFFDPAASLGQPKMDTLAYSEVEGSPFLDPRWSAGTFYLNDTKPFHFAQMKYNAYNGEIHYVDAHGEELAVGAQQVNRFTLMKPKSPAEVAGNFEAMTDMFSDDRRSFYRILNEGKYRLVVLDRCTVKKGNFDPLLGKKELHFVTRTWYGIAEYEYVHPIFILDKERIDKELSFKPDQQKWLKDNHNNLKSEAEVIAFLGYLNSTTISH
jgi:hypothetical protein